MAPRVLPGRDPSGSAEVLHATDRTRVTRLFLPEGTVIRKEPLGSDGPRRLRHELAMLQRLRGVPGIAQVLEEPRFPDSISLEDEGGVSLASLTTPLDPRMVIRLGVALARAVAGMHGGAVMHRDISPGNIVVSADGTPCLVDFALAAPLAEIRPEFTPRSEIIGTLEYLAPEQTGRTGRAVDQRADLYAFGATLYDLATGAPPFGSGDPLRLTHDHLATVPVPPAEVNPAVPRSLSDLILHLLEKEPDDRYQTAEGVAHDLELLQQETDPAAAVRLGEQDFPLRLRPPSRLVGRAAELAALRVAFDEAAADRGRAVLVTGPPGVGKTALVDELRPVVAARDGWFVAGKFDQYRKDLESDGLHQALRALGRLLLAQPDDELARVRERLLAALAGNAGLVAATLPEFATLLSVPPDPGDPLTAQVRAQHGTVELLRAVASRERPVVLFLDDLQWAGPTPAGLVDLVLNEGQIGGLLLVAAYRDGEHQGGSGRTGPGPVVRVREPNGVLQLPLGDIARPDLLVMVADILQAEPAAAAGLVEVIYPHTAGNPYETVELLTALRRDGRVTATGAGWRWDSELVRRHLDSSDVGEVLMARIAASPPRTRELLAAMACLGGRAEVAVLRAAVGESEAAVDRTLAPAFDEGALVMVPGAREAVRFRHDRIREIVLQGLGPARRRSLQLTMARRLAAAPESYAVAAETYLPVVDEISAPGERRRVVDLLRRAADEAALIGDYAHVDVLLSGAVPLIDPADAAETVAVRMARHAARFSLGRLDEADEDYRVIEGLSLDPVRRAEATAVQVRSLSHRTRYAEALTLALASLRELGVDVPAAGGFIADFDRLYRWLDTTDPADDRERPELVEAALIARARLIEAVLPVAYFVADPPMIAWLALEALGIWIEHGPSSVLVGPAGHAAYHVGAQGGDFPTAYRALQRIVALGEAHGYEPGTSQARYMSSAIVGWYEPVENGVRAAQQAREGLIAGDDLAYAGYTYQLSVPYSAECAPTLTSLDTEIDSGLAYLRRTGNEQTGRWLDSYHWLVRALRGDDPGGTSATIPFDSYADDPLALVYAHLCRSIAAAIFGDPAALAEHTAAAMQLLPAFAGFYAIAQVRMLRALAVAERARGADGGERGDLLSELDETIRWFEVRAADAPLNFQHMMHLIEAERAWAAGDFRVAVLAFDAALLDVEGRSRPWHRGLIAERAARFHLANGAERAGRGLIAEARDAYTEWGATAKLAQLDWAFPTTRPAGAAADLADAGAQRSTVTTGVLDLLGILSASRALSSETSIGRLQERVVEVVSAMTGATGVQLCLWSEDEQRWITTPGPGGAAGPLGGVPLEPDRPMSVLRYVQRVREPLLVDDATRDDRFARDPYFAGGTGCSLLALPIVSRGDLRAVLLLENRLIHGAFTADRLDAVELIAAQLTVSLDNAQLYAELAASRARIVAAGDQTRRRIERDLHDGAQQRLITLALGARLARATVPSDAGDLAARLEALAVEADHASDELRELAHGIHPAVLTEGGLQPALRALARRSAVPVTLHVRVEGRLAEQVETATYFTVAEALSNTAKHAHATVAALEVGIGDEGMLRVRISDDGGGGADIRAGSGLLGLKDRVEALGGRFSVQTAPGAGTTVRADLPLVGVGASSNAQQLGG